jgi:peptidoglycan/LPS O-acetylase OafA/YrhL
VIGFHFNLFGFWGGYLGVDIFFVLSGFLITRNLLRGEKKEIKIWEFWGKRILRL